METNGGSKKAIIIAVSDYEILQPLDFCKSDGNEMYAILKSLNYEIQENHKLVGRVKWQDLRRSIIDFFRNRNIKPRDTLLFYFSGHGVLDAFGDHYLAPSELDPFEPDANGFLFDELTRVIDKSNSQRIVTILDCCYSGAAKIGKGGEEDAANAGRKAIDEKSRILERGEGKCILAASQAYQKAFETTQKDHSLFTHFLIEGLKGNEEAVDNYGCVTPDLLGKFIYNRIMSLPVEKQPHQKPIRKVQQSGDIVLAYYPQFAKMKDKNSMLQSENSTLSHPDAFKIKSDVDKHIIDIYDKVIMFEEYAKKKPQRGFSISVCANDLGIGVNELRSILQYRKVNKFRCPNCIQ
jgi:hypothetical protein